jgi:hypothetical protein
MFCLVEFGFLYLKKTCHTSSFVSRSTAPLVSVFHLAALQLSQVSVKTSRDSSARQKENLERVFFSHLTLTRRLSTWLDEEKGQKE